MGLVARREGSAPRTTGAATTAEAASPATTSITEPTNLSLAEATGRVYAGALEQVESTADPNRPERYERRQPGCGGR
jgi:hypothetical protein